MATILYREGQPERIAPEYVADCLTNGYFVTREESLGEVPGIDTPEDVEELADEYKELAAAKKKTKK